MYVSRQKTLVAVQVLRGWKKGIARRNKRVHTAASIPAWERPILDQGKRLRSKEPQRGTLMN